MSRILVLTIGLSLFAANAQAELKDFFSRPSGSVGVQQLAQEVSGIAREVVAFQGYDSATRSAVYAGRTKLCRVTGDMMVLVKAPTSAMPGAQRQITVFVNPELRISADTESGFVSGRPTTAIKCE
jgi:hypothetical protein